MVFVLSTRTASKKADASNGIVAIVGLEILPILCTGSEGGYHIRRIVKSLSGVAGSKIAVWQNQGDVDAIRAINRSELEILQRLG